jgi:ABC-type dipeptide/oligopeptide/nickel transport system ATPase component
MSRGAMANSKNRAGHIPSEQDDKHNSPAQPLLAVHGLAVRLPTGPRAEVQAVQCVDLVVGPGERVGIVGESGSGKSVTGRAIAGLLPQSPRVKLEGSIRFHGAEFVGAPSQRWMDVRRNLVSMIFQDPLSSLNPTMRIGPQVAEAGRPPLANEKVHEYLDMAGLPDPSAVARMFPFELSGGMRQRVSIAIALAKRPELVIADEPTTALDVTVQARVLKTLKQSVDELGTSLLMISHDLAVIAQMCDRVYVMYNGRVVESGDTYSVFTNPREKYTQGLLRSVRSLSSADDALFAFGHDETRK